VVVNGTQVLLSVPGGVSHDVWSDGNNALRLMQVANDTDFEVEVKFESALSQRHQLQGLLVEQDGGNFLRLDFYSDGSSTRVFAAKFVNGVPTIVHDSAPLPGGVQPLYLKVGRQGHTWTQSYSTDGQAWAQAVRFEHVLSVGQVGVFSGNAGGSAPGAHGGGGLLLQHGRTCGAGRWQDAYPHVDRQHGGRGQRAALAREAHLQLRRSGGVNGAGKCGLRVRWLERGLDGEGQPGEPAD
jgi:hypothetical protein